MVRFEKWQSGRLDPEQAPSAAQDEANAAFQDELKRQQQLRDLIRRNREQRNKRQYFNPEQDK